MFEMLNFISFKYLDNLLLNLNNFTLCILFQAKKKKFFQAVNQKSVSDAEKREKLIVIKKLEGLEKELKVDSNQKGFPIA